MTLTRFTRGQNPARPPRWLDAAVPSCWRARRKSDELLGRGDLLFLLYRWKEFAADDGGEVRAWLTGRMQRDEVLVVLTKALTGEAWTTGLGGFGSLGDRVSRRQVRAQVNDDFALFDPVRYRMELERIVREQRPPEALDAVRLHLGAWIPGKSSD